MSVQSGVYHLGGYQTPLSVGAGVTYYFTGIPASHPMRVWRPDGDAECVVEQHSCASPYPENADYCIGDASWTIPVGCDHGVFSLECAVHGAMGATDRLVLDAGCGAVHECTHLSNPPPTPPPSPPPPPPPSPPPPSPPPPPRRHPPPRRRPRPSPPPPAPPPPRRRRRRARRRPRRPHPRRRRPRRPRRALHRPRRPRRPRRHPHPAAALALAATPAPAAASPPPPSPPPPSPSPPRPRPAAARHPRRHHRRPPSTLPTPTSCSAAPPSKAVAFWTFSGTRLPPVATGRPSRSVRTNRPE